jgi:hypothetical protein
MAIRTVQKVSQRDEVQTRFAGLVLQRLRSDGVTRAQFDGEHFAIRIFDGHGTVKTSIMLEKAFAEFMETAADQRNEVIYRYIAAARTAGSSLPTTLRRASYNILPRVAPRFVLEEMEFNAHIRGLELSIPAASNSFSTVPHIAISRDHCLTAVYDFPTHVVTLQCKSLLDWGTSFEDVLEIGMRNLTKISEEPFEELCEGLYVSPYSDNHDASRILLTDKIRSECRVKGEHVALLLNRDTLLIADSSIPAALQAAASVASTTMQEPRPYSALPLVLDGNVWHDFQLNEFHPAYDDFSHMRLFAFADMYKRQKELLESFHERTQQEVFAATCVVLKDPGTDELFSFGTWTEGVDTLLPESDYIVFVQPSKPENEQTTRCRFSRALQVVPHLLQDTGLYPQRYLVRGFPSEKEMRELSR